MRDLTVRFVVQIVQNAILDFRRSFVEFADLCLTLGSFAVRIDFVANCLLECCTYILRAFMAGNARKAKCTMKMK